MSGILIFFFSLLFLFNKNFEDNNHRMFKKNQKIRNMKNVNEKLNEK